MENLFSLAREMAQPKVWSAGVELARNADFQSHRGEDSSERVVRIVQGAKDRIVTVSLSPENELWQCDCGSDDDPCKHVIATILAFKQQRVESGQASRQGSLRAGGLVHSFTRRGAILAFERVVVFDGERVTVAGTLVQAVTTFQKQHRLISPTDDELKIDYVLPSSREEVLAPKDMRHLLPALSRVRVVELDGAPILVSRDPLMVAAEVVDEGQGYRLRRFVERDVSEIFDNGAAIRGGMLCAVEDSSLRMEDITLLRGEGTFFSKARGLELATRIIPMLQGKISVQIRSTMLPRARRVAPRIVIEAIADSGGDSLTAIPRMVYGDPIIADVRGGELIPHHEREIPIRDVVEESRLSRELGVRLGLTLDQARVFKAEEGVRFASKLKGWSTSGEGAAIFTPTSSLTPHARSLEGELNLEFVTPAGDKVSLERLMAAWRAGQSSARFDSGSGWATLPLKWLEQHGEALKRLFEARQDDQRIPSRMLGEVSEICESLGVAAPEYFAKLKAGLEDIAAIPNAPLPPDLRAELRSYQRLGVNWLSFLLSHGLGALLADDMGLGKTLQALCVVQGRTLIVCPTSVLSSWEEQLTRFRPALTVSVFHGQRRALDRAADVVITSYALLRLDREELCAPTWDTVVLDEAQTIRNPESQVAQAAYQLKGRARISLSGTPVENSLEDLWSQYNVLNPGLLGSYRSFRETYAQPIESGDTRRAAELQRRVTPFMLRRLKRDVAKELPPKTEVILECELQPAERVVYDAVLGAARGDLLKQLEDGAGYLSALETLLRLRQACCHIALIPGQDAQRSSKVDLLIESLERSLAQGHRALVFSQWTSLLDLIEPHLLSSGITFLRIDGTTEGRGELVEQFQSSEGPPVMLLSLKAGGLGLTLTRADHVYIVDPWWNPAVEDQAADRAYRIGQENPVIVHRLVATNTIEERILELQARKRELLSAAIGEPTGALSLSREEVLDLLR
jgi:hypothetical protein